MDWYGGGLYGGFDPYDPYNAYHPYDPYGYDDVAAAYDNLAAAHEYEEFMSQYHVPDPWRPGGFNRTRRSDNAREELRARIFARQQAWGGGIFVDPLEEVRARRRARQYAQGRHHFYPRHRFHDPDPYDYEDVYEEPHISSPDPSFHGYAETIHSDSSPPFSPASGSFHGYAETLSDSSPNLSIRTGTHDSHDGPFMSGALPASPPNRSPPFQSRTDNQRRRGGDRGRRRRPRCCRDYSYSMYQSPAGRLGLSRRENPRTQGGGFCGWLRRVEEKAERRWLGRNPFADVIRNL